MIKNISIAVLTVSVLVLGYFVYKQWCELNELEPATGGN